MLEYEMQNYFLL